MSVIGACAPAVLISALLVSGCGIDRSPARTLAPADALRLRHEREASQRAVTAYREALTAWRGRWPRDAALAARGLGETLRELGSLTESLAAFREALRLAQQFKGDLFEAELKAEVGFALALAADRTEALDEADRLCADALDTARRLRGLREEAKALSCQAEVIYSRGGNFAPAFQLQEQAEAIWTTVGDQRGIAQAWLSRGWLHSDARELEKAQIAFDRARALYESVGDRRGLAITLVADARLLERRGEYQESLKVFDKAQALLETVGDMMWEGSCLTSKGLIYQYLADLPRALDHRERGLRALESSGLKIFAIDALMSLGLAYLDSGDEEAALSRFERAFTLAGELQNLRWQAWALRNIALVHLGRQRPELAAPYLERALGFLPGLEERRLEAQLSHGLGQVFESRGAYEEARGHYERSFSVSRAAGDRNQMSRALRALGSLEARMGRFSLARMRLATALAEDELMFGPAHPLVAESRTALAELDFATDHLAAALAASIDAERTSLDHLRVTVRYLPERQALAFASRRPRGLDLAISSAAADDATHVARVYDLVIQSRGVILDELAARSRGGAPSDPTRSAVYETAHRARQRYANLLVRSLEGAVPRGELDGARHEKESAERALAAQSVDIRTEGAGIVGMQQVREGLPPGTVLVSFVQYTRYLRAGRQRAASPRVVSLAAFVLSARSSRVRLVPLGPIDAIEPLLTEWRGLVLTRGLAGGAASAAGTEQALRLVGTRLRRAIWDPLSVHVQRFDRVLIVPDGSLSLLPLGALPGRQTEFVIEEGPPIHYLTAERDVVTASSASQVRRAGILAIGGATFDEMPRVSTAAGALAVAGGTNPLDLRGDRSGCGSLQSLRFEPLAGTGEEVREISALWPAALGPPRALVGLEASEGAFKRDAPAYGVLHVATHGFFLDDSCLPASQPHVTARGVGGLATTGPVENPLRLSGLALAGANRRAQARAEEDDGILTAEEVATLDLQGVEWAVLSACDTGVGEIKAGEGVFGLRRAFQVAGARTVIMSLWSVEDQATRAWMRTLYEGRFQKKLSTADAVHQASLTALRDRRARGLGTHPFFWAAFVAAGDWR